MSDVLTHRYVSAEDRKGGWTVCDKCSEREATIERLTERVASLSGERECLIAGKAEVTRERDEARADLKRLTVEWDWCQGQLAAMRPVVEAVAEWAALRMEFDALTASVMQRFADAGRPPGFSAWTEDGRKRHTVLLEKMLVKLNAVEAAYRDAEKEADRE